MEKDKVIDKIDELKSRLHLYIIGQRRSTEVAKSAAHLGNMIGSQESIILDVMNELDEVVKIIENGN